MPHHPLSLSASLKKRADIVFGVKPSRRQAVNPSDVLRDVGDLVGGTALVISLGCRSCRPGHFETLDGHYEVIGWAL